MNFSKSVGVFLVVIFGFTYVKHVQSLQCYNCVACNDPFDEDGNKNNAMSCTGSCLKISYGDKAVRTCSPISLGDSCEDYTYEGHEANRCSCTTDKCNHSNSLHLSLVSTVALLAAAFYFKRL
ncbi:uncharacterized protein LOC123554170 isoform X2 [Mercenaria mercenaria]|nr:uncharacterized protein LOC123554170 isoform X2 [Mercenaria mercenaria]